MLIFPWNRIWPFVLYCHIRTNKLVTPIVLPKELRLSLYFFFFSCFLTSVSLYPLPHLHRLVTLSTKQVKLDRPTMHTYNYKIHHSTTFGPIMEAPHYINKYQFHNLGAYSLTIKFQKNILSGTSDLEHI